MTQHRTRMGEHIDLRHPRLLYDEARRLGTTKPEGSGIGLALSRQIAEGHGGGLALQNRRGGSGCRAEVWLPLS